MAKKENRNVQKPIAGSYREPLARTEEDPKVTPTPVNPPPKLLTQRRPIPDGSRA